MQFEYKQIIFESNTGAVMFRQEGRQDIVVSMRTAAAMVKAARIATSLLPFDARPTIEVETSVTLRALRAGAMAIVVDNRELRLSMPPATFADILEQLI